MTVYGIRVRPNVCSIPNTLRFSLGTPEQNDILLGALGITLAVQKKTPRLTSVTRNTKETQIDATVNLDAPSFVKIDTGIGFFDHMLEQIAQHGGFGLALTCQGDLHVDAHHTIEDCALVLGEVIKKALSDKRGVGRYGFSAPLDEALASVTLDLSGRPSCVFNGNFNAPIVGDMPTEMIPHFFQSFANALGAAVHVTVTGQNAHHESEACFKALGRALRQAIALDGDVLPSTKGVL
ncbi:MAG TPA: imidazoleglycerol-phosphate dehydratase HisB [Rhodospirillaceae bacterium]|nr:imidazoleglycerol-phosphate dehydratase HisB [Rhodospirillaceae bacterium]